MLSESEVKQRFGDVLATLPPPPRHFTLPFRFDSEELTEEGQRLVQDVLQAVKSYPVPDVSWSGTPTPRARRSRTRSSDCAAPTRCAVCSSPPGSPVDDRHPIARRGRAPRADRRRRLRAQEPPRRNHGAMIPRSRSRRLILLCGLVPTLARRGAVALPPVAVHSASSTTSTIGWCARCRRDRPAGASSSSTWTNAASPPSASGRGGATSIGELVPISRARRGRRSALDIVFAEAGSLRGQAA